MNLNTTQKLKPNVNLTALPVEDRIWALVQAHRPQTPDFLSSLSPSLSAPLSPHWEPARVLIAQLLAVRFTQRGLYPKGSEKCFQLRPSWVALHDLPPRLQAWLASRRVQIHSVPVTDYRQIERPLCFAYALTDLQPLMPRGLSIEDLFEMDLLIIANLTKLKSRVLLSMVLLALDETPGSEADSAKVRLLLDRHIKEMRRPNPSQAKAWGVDHLLARFLGPPEEKKPADANGKPAATGGSVAQTSASATANKIRLPPLPAPLLPGMARWAICQASAAMARKAAMPTSSNRTERAALLESFAQRPYRDRPMAQRNHVEAVEALRACFPNFSGVLDLIVPHLQLQVRLGAPLQLPPVLMLGLPGVGKTHFAWKLAQVLDAELEARDLAGTTAGFVITGSTSTWAEAQPGCIARLLERMPDGKTPMVFLDELDKARNGNFPPDQVLLSLLEPRSAMRFRDEHLDLEFDARPISFLLACNRIENIRPELLSRVQVIEVLPPSPEQMPTIIRSVDAELRRETPQMDYVFLPLSDALIGNLSVHSPRELGTTLKSAYARAGWRTRGQGDPVMVLPEDLPKDVAADAGTSTLSVPSSKSLMCVPRVWQVH